MCFFIYSIFARNLIKRPSSIKSPSFPIMINYPLKNFEIFHYDLYRLINENELKELNINEKSFMDLGSGSSNLQHQFC